MTEEQPEKKAEVASGHKRLEANKISETAAQKDQTEKFRSMRRELAKGERAFSVTSLVGSTNGAKFELSDGTRRIAAATKPQAALDQSTIPKHPATEFGPRIQTAVAGVTIDMNQATRDAEAIRRATGNDNYVARWADRDAINKILEGKTQAERQAIDSVYQNKYGHGLEKEVRGFESGSDLDKFLNLLHRADNNGGNQAARRIHEDLLENHNLVQGRGSTEIEKDVRDLLSSRNSTQMAQIDAEYKSTYGVSLRDAIKGDTKVSVATKESVDILLKGVDKRTDQDSATLIAASLRNGSTEMFAESMRDASPAARKTFLENGGETKIKAAFAHWNSNKDVQHAMDYARDGKLSAATQVADNTGLVFDNTKGIELAINRMTDHERKMYLDGKLLAEGKSVAGLSGQDEQKSRDYYSGLHRSLAATANATETVKYENMISSKSDNTLVASLASARGTFWNSSTSDIVGDIKNMTQTQFEDCKQHPNRRAELQQMLTSLSKGETEVAQALGVYDKMMTAPDLAHARDLAAPGVFTEIDANKHWYGNNSKEILNSIANMSTADQKRYRDDTRFRGNLDKQIEGSLEMPSQRDAAQRMLQQVKEGKAPDSDAIATLEQVQNYDGSKSSQVVRDIEQSFKTYPEMRDRVLHPETAEDKRYAEQFKSAAQSALGDDYEIFGKPLCEQGHLPLELKMGMNRGAFSNDYKQSFEDLQQATPGEKQRLKTDPAYAEQVLGFMDQNRRQVAMATLDQRQLRTEDNIRAAVVGFGGSADIVEQLKQVKPEELAQLKSDYARKYGSSLEGDVMSKLGSSDKDAAERVFTQNLSQDERANIALTQTENARSGFGASVSDNVFRSGTGAQADDAQNETVRLQAERNRSDAALASGAALARQMTKEQVETLQAQMSAQIERSIQNQNQATDNNVDSKKKGAEYAGDALAVGGAIGSMIVTGGVDAPLVLSLAAAGAGVKVGSNIALQGNNYDLSIKQVGVDAGVGSVTAATSVLGPGEVAAIFGIGKAAAAEAAKITIAQTGTQILAQGGRETIQLGTQKIVQNALASGAKQISREDFNVLAQRAISPDITGAARERAVQDLSAGLERNVSEQIANGVVTRMGSHGLNASSGAIGGGAGGAVQGASEWDSRKSTAENMAAIAERSAESAATGFLTGGATSAGVSGVSGAWRAVNGALRTGENTASRETAAVARLEVEAPVRRPAQPEAGKADGAQAAPRAHVEHSPQTASPTPAEVEAKPARAAEEREARPDAADAPASRERPATEGENLKGRRVNDQGQVLDSQGKPIEVEWPAVKRENIEAVRGQVRVDLAQVKASNGRSVLENLENSPLNETQRTRVLDALGEVREHYAKTFKIDPDQPVNWIHTQGELGRILDAAQSWKAKPQELEDALLASMFSDSLKTKANFTTHHLDGELAAEHLLKDKLGGGFTQERLDGILHAIKEHQIAPPKFMAMIYGLNIRRLIGMEGRKLTAEEDTALASLQKKISDPFNQEKFKGEDGGYRLVLNPEEKALLARTGADEWHIPDESTPWYKISRMLIDGDGIDNYATPGGLSKIIQIRGPETGQFFQDGNFRYENPNRTAGGPPSSSQESWRDSFRDFATVASPENLLVAESAARDAEKSAIAAQGRVDAWLHQRLNIPENQPLPMVPGWTGTPELDAAGNPIINPNGTLLMRPDNLTYPKTDNAWWAIHNKPVANRTAEEQAIYDDPANRYRGLSQGEIDSFKLAKEIRDRYAAELRREQRVAGDEAPVYAPAVQH